MKALRKAGAKAILATIHLCPLSPEACQHALAHGFQRQRRAAAFELALARPETPLFNWRQPGRAQQRSLKAPTELAADSKTTQA